MIVNYVEEGWEIITQRAHGLLAGQICARWKISDQPDRWVETLMATTEHDDVFNELERSPLLTEQGGPINFKMTRFDKYACENLIDRGLTKSRFITLLLSRHISFTHGKEQQAEVYLSVLKKKEKKWKKEGQITTEQLDRAYELLEFCDALSLLICQKQIPPEQRKLEISSGPSGKSYYTFQKEDKLLVEPWPFEIEKFEVIYECFSIDRLKFSSDKQFRDDLRKATPVLKRIVISSD